MSCQSFKTWKNWGYKGSFLTICNFVFSSTSNLAWWICLSMGTSKGTNMFNGLANLGTFHWRETQWILLERSLFSLSQNIMLWIELCQDVYLSVCKLYNLSQSVTFWQFFPWCFFLFDLSFRHRRPMNITGVVAGNPRFHHTKTVWS